MNAFNPTDQSKTVDSSSRQPFLAFGLPPEQIAPQQLSSASSYADLNYLFGTQDPKMLAPKSSRNRRKSHGPDHVKHRRTRSGCYTCRSRRVKCDEAHPICERCRKGSRDCVYPESSTSSKGSGSSSSKAQTGTHEELGSSSDEFDEDGDAERLEAIQDGDENAEDETQSGKPMTSEGITSSSSQPQGSRRTSIRHASETPSLVQDKGASPTPSTEGSIGYSTYRTLGKVKPEFSSVQVTEDGIRDWPQLPPDLRFYLAYFCENVTYLHYSWKFDSGKFLHTQFLDIALRNDALLHAIVGFSAFQRTLHNPDGKIEDFLPYYNKAVSLLLGSLRKGERHDIGTILAILQLATIEEFLGDWINLLGHQKAACEILTKIYTPHTIMQSEMSRIVLGWYIRFDVFAGLLGGFQTVLSREWLSYACEFHTNMVSIEPEKLDWRVEAALSHSRLLAMDMSLLFSKMGKGEMSMEQFMTENNSLATRIEQWESHMDPALQDPRYVVNDFSDARPRDPDDIVDPYLPNNLYGGPLWVMNTARIDWLSIDLMHRYQTALTMRSQPGAELAMKAYTSCQLFEAVEFYPGSPRGAVVACQASLGIASLFLPRDERHGMWARRKLATIESNGYIYPFQFRSKMTDLFRDPSCMHWWLPNDERYPKIVRSIRRFVEARTTPAKDLSSEDLRDMRGIFASLNLDDGKSSQTFALETGKEQSPEQEWSHSGMEANHLQQVGGVDDGYQFRLTEGQVLLDQRQDEGSFGSGKPRGFP